MSWVHEALAGFGRQIGLPELHFDQRHVAQVDLQAGGFLAVELAGPQVLVYVGRPVGFDGAKVVREALVGVHTSNRFSSSLQVAVQGDGPEAAVIALARIHERAFTTHELARVVDFLYGWLDRVRHG